MGDNSFDRYIAFAKCFSCNWKGDTTVNAGRKAKVHVRKFPEHNVEVRDNFGVILRRGVWDRRRWNGGKAL